MHLQPTLLWALTVRAQSCPSSASRTSGHRGSYDVDSAKVTAVWSSGILFCQIMYRDVVPFSRCNGASYLQASTPSRDPRGSKFVRKIKVMDCSSIDDQVCTLVRKITSKIEDKSLGTFTVSIYDTAWVSMVFKAGNEVEHWIIKQ